MTRRPTLHSFVRLQERDFQETPRCTNSVEHSEVELGAPGPDSLSAAGVSAVVCRGLHGSCCVCSAHAPSTNQVHLT